MRLNKLFITLILVLGVAVNSWAAFPTTSILDNFDRSNEDLDVSASWTQIGNADDLKVISNVVGCTATAPYGYAGDYWDDATFTDSEAFATISTLPATDGNVLVCLRTTATDLLTSDGYSIQYTVLTGAANDELRLFRIDNGVGTQIGSTSTADVAAGTQIGLSAIGSTITGYKDGVEFASGTDTTYGGAGYLSVLVKDTTTRLNNFGGGTYIPPAVTPARRRVIVVN